MKFELALKELRRGFKVTHPSLSFGVYLLPKFLSYGRKKRIEVVKMRDSEEIVDKRIDLCTLLDDGWRVLK